MHTERTTAKWLENPIIPSSSTAAERLDRYELMQMNQILIKIKPPVKGLRLSENVNAGIETKEESWQGDIRERRKVCSFHIDIAPPTIPRYFWTIGR